MSHEAAFKREAATSLKLQGPDCSARTNFFFSCNSCFLLLFFWGFFAFCCSWGPQKVHFWPTLLNGCKEKAQTCFLPCLFLLFFLVSMSPLLAEALFKDFQPILGSMFHRTFSSPRPSAAFWAAAEKVLTLVIESCFCCWCHLYGKPHTSDSLSTKR